MHGFPLDWNLWSIHAWPDKIAEIEAVTDKPVWVTEVGVGFVRRGGGAGLRYPPHRGTSRRPRPAHLLVLALYDLPMAWGAETRHREAEGSSYYRHFYMGLIREDGTPKPALEDYGRVARDVGLMQWFHFEDPRLDDAVAWMKRLGTRKLRTGLSWADSFRPGAIDWFDRQMEAIVDFDVTLTFCFTPQHLGVAPHHTSPPLDPQGFADFCAWMIDRYAPRARRPRRRDADRMLEPVRPTVRVALVGIGNCASSLVQGLAYYRHGTNDMAGLLHAEIGGLRPSDIDIVAAWDVDRRKVGLDVAEAIFAKPNCTTIFCPEVEPCHAVVAMGRTLDGVAAHMLDCPDEDRTFVPADAPEPTHAEVVARLREAGVDVMVNYLPVGSQQATEFYAQCALDAGVAFVNAIPVFIASDPVVGQTISCGWRADHRRRHQGADRRDDRPSRADGPVPPPRRDARSDLPASTPAAIPTSSTCRTGAGLSSKKISKTEAVQAVAASRLADENIHVGPSDYVAWQNDNKVCFLRMEGRIFGGSPMNLEMRLSVEDSPNSAGVAIDMVRCAKLARDRGIGGPIESASAFFCKHPARQMTDDAAADAFEAFIAGLDAGSAG